MIPAIEVRDLTRRYGEVCALDGLDLSLPLGQWTSVVGPSGAGKTTLLRILAALEAADRGSVTHPSGEGVRGLLVYQDYVLFPAQRVWENVAYGLRCRGVGRREARDRAETFLASMGLEGRGLAWPHELSAGQQQRVALARALILDPPLLLLDEPFANLDPSRRAEVATLLRAHQEDRGLTLVCVTHDQEEAFLYGDQVAVLERGRRVVQGRPSDLAGRPLPGDQGGAMGEVNWPEGPQGRPCLAWHTVFTPGSGDAELVEARPFGPGWRLGLTLGGRHFWARTLQPPPPEGSRGTLTFEYPEIGNNDR